MFFHLLRHLSFIFVFQNGHQVEQIAHEKVAIGVQVENLALNERRDKLLKLKNSKSYASN